VKDHNFSIGVSKIAFKPFKLKKDFLVVKIILLVYFDILALILKSDLF